MAHGARSSLLISIRNDWIWLRLAKLGHTAVLTSALHTRSGIKTKGRSLKPNPKPKPWFRKGPKASKLEVTLRFREGALQIVLSLYTAHNPKW